MEFGFTIPSRPIVVDDIRVRGVAKACAHSVSPLSVSDRPPNPTVTVRAFNDDYSTCYIIVLMYLFRPQPVLSEIKFTTLQYTYIYLIT